MGGSVRVEGADSKANSTGFAGTLVVSAGPARLYSVTIYNGSGGNVYLQIFNTTAVQTAGAWTAGSEPLLQVLIPATATGGVDFKDGALFPVGVSVACSSSPTQYTAVASAALIYATYHKKL